MFSFLLMMRGLGSSRRRCKGFGGLISNIASTQKPPLADLPSLDCSSATADDLHHTALSNLGKPALRGWGYQETQWARAPVREKAHCRGLIRTTGVGEGALGGKTTRQERVRAVLWLL